MITVKWWLSRMVVAFLMFVSLHGAIPFVRIWAIDRKDEYMCICAREPPLYGDYTTMTFKVYIRMYRHSILCSLIHSLQMKLGAYCGCTGQAHMQLNLSVAVEQKRNFIRVTLTRWLSGIACLYHRVSFCSKILLTFVCNHCFYLVFLCGLARV